MTAGIEDYEQIYQQAYLAYVETNYEQAATFIDQVVPNLPNDANVRLLRGHIYFVLQQYDVAQQEYEKVLELTDDPNITTYAQNGLDSIVQYQYIDENGSEQEEIPRNFSDLSEAETFEDEHEELEDLEEIDNISNSSFNLKSFEDEQEAIDKQMEEIPVSNPFDIPVNDSPERTTSSSQENVADNPFAVNPEILQNNSSESQDYLELELPSFIEEDISELKFIDTEEDSQAQVNSTNSTNQNSQSGQESNQNPFSQFELPPPSSGLEEQDIGINMPEEPISQGFSLKKNMTDDETLLTSEINLDISSKNSTSSSSQDNKYHQSQNTLERQGISNSHTQTSVPNSRDVSSSFHSFAQEEQHYSNGNSKTPQPIYEDDDSFDFEAFESAFGSESFTEDDEPNSARLSGNLSTSNNIEFLDDFDEFDDLGSIPGFNIVDDDSPLRSTSMENNSKSRPKAEKIPSSENSDFTSPSHVISDRDSELFSITGSQEGVPVFSQGDVSKVEPQVSVEQGVFAPLENATLQTKQWVSAGVVGVVSALVVATVSFTAANLSNPQQRETLRNTGWAMSLAAGFAGFATTGLMGNLTFKQIRRTTKDLQAQFDAVSQGNLNVQAAVYSEDELGQLAAGLNEMARIIFTTTNEATRKAQEQEEAKENLQRQVIRLLDDVEGAARGDLTVQAEVTADVLGAVADAFNLTIQNLRDIVQQVKVAAREVTRGATNSETFARALSSDALRQAEELAVTLNSVQVMTDSIQRVAVAAREAEAVARDASEIALKGGDAVENTVAGILEIRETVAETTRKVKRLAESSQEISKIVALISQIASRTNLLALNASIEAARAGEAGRGFATVADEVRQLADKSAKSLKEIEQIVMQIQSETGSVMTAMEEGTQQVIKGTKLAEEAKRSLEDIIQVAKHIDSLVRGITADTVEQTETSRAVAQVMQSVELTAQETSQEAQRVSGALQHLVGVSRDLIASVERFRVETNENTR
ncbi:MAG: methyl-accepting chemotaxis protein [Scytonema sp. PMC 1069.18]|nr:methyl-accepting chemotaxis protein [Scytonema sp. PMC 1069.18]